MASRPQNIGIKAIEIYFPSQVRVYAAPWHPRTHATSLTADLANRTQP
jgi:hypothetical protein